MANLVIFFRDQELSHEQHKAFGRRFGELHLHPTSTRGGEHPEVLVIKADENSKHVAGEEWALRRQLRYPNRRWAASST